MWKSTLSAAIACFTLSLFIAPSANAACACMCVDGVSMNVCTGFVSSQTVTDECTAALECPAVADEPVEPEPEPEITNADNPDVPPGFSCRPRKVWRPDLDKYKMYKVCSPRDLVASNDDPDWKHGRKHRDHKWKNNKKRKAKRHHRRHRHDDDDDDDDDDD